jgi:hypothetical protein
MAAQIACTAALFLAAGLMLAAALVYTRIAGTLDKAAARTARHDEQLMNIHLELMSDLVAVANLDAARFRAAQKTRRPAEREEANITLTDYDRGSS